MPKRKYCYDAVEDCYICLNNCRRHYQTTERGGNRLYVSNPADCRNCPLLSTCTASADQRKVLARHVWESYRERARENRLSEYGKTIYARRKKTVEHSFADAKQLHGHRYAKMRGLRKVQEQSLLCAWAANIKKIALPLSKGGRLYAVYCAHLAYFTEYACADHTPNKLVTCNKPERRLKGTKPGFGLAKSGLCQQSDALP